MTSISQSLAHFESLEWFIVEDVGREGTRSRCGLKFGFQLCLAGSPGGSVVAVASEPVPRDCLGYGGCGQAWTSWGPSNSSRHAIPRHAEYNTMQKRREISMTMIPSLGWESGRD